MIALQISDIKQFMNQLLLSSTFDSFRVQEAVITTFASFSIDGHVRRDYYSGEERETLGLEEESLALWSQLKPFCLQLIKGKKTPLGMKLVFQLSEKNTEKLLLNLGLTYSVRDIGGLFLHIRYDGQSLICVTGTSLNIFTMDKTLELEWDRTIQKFLESHEISFSI